MTDNIEIQEDTIDQDYTDMGLEDLEGKWLKNPKVGEELILTIEKLVKNKKNTTGKDPTTGKSFSTALSSVDYNVEVHCKEGIYTLNTWQVWGKLKAGLKALQNINGVVIRIKHNLDGMKSENKGKEIYSVHFMIDGSWCELNGTEFKKIE